MEFMETYYRADLLDEAKAMLPEAIGVFAQLDVWDTHLFTIHPEDGGFEVCMYNVENPFKGQEPSLEELGEGLCNGEDDNANYSTLGEALDNVTGGYSDGIEGLPADLKAALDECQEAEKVAGMSKYARKKYLQAKALEEEEAEAS